LANAVISVSRVSRMLVLAGLCVLGAGMSLWLLGNDGLQPGAGLWITIAAGVAPPLALIGVAVRRANRWGEWIALFMVPYFCIGTMDVVAGSGALWLPILVAGSSLVTFFAALDAVRRDA
jgi:uncharacterized membrane protein